MFFYVLPSLSEELLTAEDLLGVTFLIWRLKSFGNLLTDHAHVGNGVHTRKSPYITSSLKAMPA